jgi:hypothetical protein
MLRSDGGLRIGRLALLFHVHDCGLLWWDPGQTCLSIEYCESRDAIWPDLIINMLLDACGLNTIDCVGIECCGSVVGRWHLSQVYLCCHRTANLENRWKKSYFCFDMAMKRDVELREWMEYAPL